VSRLSQIAALSRLAARHPGAAAALARWKPFSITAFEMTRALRVQGLRPGLVIDGGANVGQFARAAAETFPDARVVSFEPLPEIAEQFRANLGSEPRVRLIESALGSSSGTLSFGRNPYSLASSALPVVAGDALVKAHVETITVPVTTLDEALEDIAIPPEALLKLDLQGFEAEALRGADQTLRSVSHVLLEIALRPSYEGEPTFEALLDQLRPYGFRFLRPVEILRDPSGEIVQMDALFARG
jgi:FkbM family methyltransferase